MNLRLLNKISFKTECYRKNTDLITRNEHIMTEYEGTVSKLRYTETKLPLLLGEYGFTILNTELGKLLNIDINELIREYDDESSFNELESVINSGDFDVNQYKRILILHYFILHEDYRKKEITEEFIESIYRDYYFDSNIAILAYAKPLQDNSVYNDFYENHRIINIAQKPQDIIKNEIVSGYEYYNIPKLKEKADIEYNEYKIFSVATKCGFNRIGNSYLFNFSPDIIKARLINKMKKIEKK